MRGVEQLGTDGRIRKYARGLRRWYKKQLAKARRRAEREKLDDAPKRFTKGWAD